MFECLTIKLMEVKGIFNLRKLVEKWMKWELWIKEAEMFLGPLYNRVYQSVGHDPLWHNKNTLT